MNDNNKSLPITIIAVVALVIIIVVMIWAFNQNDEATTDTVQTDDTAVVEDEPESTLTQILDNPDAYVGQSVTVTAEVQDVLTQRIFKISDDTAGDELTVVTAQPLSAAQAEQAETFLQDNANVQVEGIVRAATVTEIERDYTLTLDPELEAEFENTTVLVAQSITFTDQNNDVWEFNVDDDPEATTEEMQ